MKIYIETDTKKKIVLPIPFGVINFFLKKQTLKWLNKHTKNKVTDSEIDFDMVAANIQLLRKYKGLTIVDVKSKDGSTVKVVV